jgi:phosphatidylglycerol:prolipoprotein diacylglycerol transferase
MSFPNGNPPSLDAQHNLVRVHPTQIYESVISLLIFAFLWNRRAAWQSRQGLVMGVYLVLAGAERFLIEFLRLNLPVAAGLTVAQWISLVLVGIGFVLIARARTSKLNAAAPARTVA